MELMITVSIDPNQTPA